MVPPRLATSDWLKAGVIVGAVQFLLYLIYWLTDDGDWALLAAYPGAYLGILLPVGSPDYAYHLVGVSANWLVFSFIVGAVLRERRLRQERNSTGVKAISGVTSVVLGSVGLLLFFTPVPGGIMNIMAIRSGLRVLRSSSSERKARVGAGIGIVMGSLGLIGGLGILVANLLAR